jgi:ketosteroid isomerase-like protein
MPDATQVATDYLDAFCDGDFDRARSLVSEDFDFVGPLTQVRGREAFFDGAAQLRPLLRGRRVLRDFADGEEQCSIYELAVSDGSVVLADWVTVRDGVVVAERLVYDTAAFLRLMPGG